MPPRYSYWTIIAGGLPTAFRAAEREELLPTYTRLREKHPDAEMKWFARGKLWDSPDAARHDLERTRGGRSHDRGDRSRNRGGDRSREREGDRPVSAKPQARGDGPDTDRTKRDRDWRPGGEHRDPRQKYVDAKKARNVQHRREKFARKQGFDARPDESARRERPGPKHGDRVTEHRGPARAREGRPASPKRWDAGREGGPAHAKRRDDWRESRPAPPKRWQDAPGGGPASRKHGSAGRGGGPASGPAQPKRWHDAREGERPSKPDWRDRQRNAGAPQRDRRENLPAAPKRRDDWRGGGPAAPKHGSTGRESGPAAPKRRDDWRGGGPASPKHGSAGRESGARGGFVERDDRPRFSGTRPFERRGFERNQGTDEPPAPPRPRGPNREPPPSESPEPTPPPRPSEPVIAPPGPPERGRLVKRPRRP
jgi:hypothetical protein